MPSKIHADYTYESCYPCKWFRQQLWRSGNPSIWHSLCEHPTTIRDGMFGKKGRLISQTNSDVRPAWCPIRDDKEAEKEAEADDAEA